MEARVGGNGGWLCWEATGQGIPRSPRRQWRIRPCPEFPGHGLLLHFTMNREINMQTAFAFLKRLFGKRAHFGNQLSDRSVRWLIENHHAVHTELLEYVEPGFEMHFESQLLAINVGGEFKADRKLGIVFGNGGGHAFIMVDKLKAVIAAFGGEIVDATSLAKAFEKLGYRIKKVEYIQFHKII